MSDKKDGPDEHVFVYSNYARRFSISARNSFHDFTTYIEKKIADRIDNMESKTQINKDTAIFFLKERILHILFKSNIEHGISNNTPDNKAIFDEMKKDIKRMEKHITIQPGIYNTSFHFVVNALFDIIIKLGMSYNDKSGVTDIFLELTKKINLSTSIKEIKDYLDDILITIIFCINDMYSSCNPPTDTEEEKYQDALELIEKLHETINIAIKNDIYDSPINETEMRMPFTKKIQKASDMIKNATANFWKSKTTPIRLPATAVRESSFEEVMKMLREAKGVAAARVEEGGMKNDAFFGARKTKRKSKYKKTKKQKSKKIKKSKKMKKRCK